MNHDTPAPLGPTLLECGTRYDLAPDYHIEFDARPFLILEAGAFPGAGAARFQHPGIWATRCRIFEFKTYLPRGGKRWHSRAGISHFFVVPKDRIRLVLDKGYSYVPVEINGTRTRLNVSGGTQNGWTDFVRASACISVGHPVRDLHRIAEVAVPGERYGLQPPPEMDPERRPLFVRLAAAAVVPRLLVRATGIRRIKLADRCSYIGDTELALVEPWPGKRALLCRRFHERDTTTVRVRYREVNWVETARLNGIEFMPPSWDALPAPVGACA